MTRLHVGTSGYAYKEWRGSFYPEKLAQKKWLAYYADHFKSVEINNTFYRYPKAAMLAKWSDAVGDDFRFVIKASRYITHRKRLKDPGDTVPFLLEQTAEGLSDKLGLIFLQLPPNMLVNLDRFKAFHEFLAARDDCPRIAWELRHE